MNTPGHKIIITTQYGQPQIKVGPHRVPRSFANLCVKHRFCLATICAHLGVTTSAMRDAFISYSGMSPKKWMRECRVLLSMRRLREGRSIVEVIKEFGYHDRPHLGKDFKQVLGEAPRAVRVKLLRSQKQSA